MELHLWLSLVVICILGALSPGPSLALVIKNTLSGGSNQGYATAISHGLGVALYAAITATGIGLLIVQSPLLFSVIKYAGAAFIFRYKVFNEQATEHAIFSTRNNTRPINKWLARWFLNCFSQPETRDFLSSTI